MRAAGKYSVLIADDDSVLRIMLKSFLDESGEFQVIGQAVNGVEAISRFTALKPDLVLLDINMPKMDGLQALEEIRKLNSTALVMMVSSNSTVDKVKEAIQKGASGFVVKPLTASAVLNKVRTCVKNSVRKQVQ